MFSFLGCYFKDFKKSPYAILRFENQQEVLNLKSNEKFINNDKKNQ